MNLQAELETETQAVEGWREDELRRKAKAEAGEAVLANRHKDKRLIEWAKANKSYVNIGRPSKYGNPFVIGEDGDRDEVCAKYEAHAKSQPWFKDIESELKGKVLVCYCWPAKCHGETLLAAANPSKRVEPEQKPEIVVTADGHQLPILPNNAKSDSWVMQFTAGADLVDALVRKGYLVPLLHGNGAVLTTKAERALQALIEGPTLS